MSEDQHMPGASSDSAWCMGAGVAWQLEGCMLDVVRELMQAYQTACLPQMAQRLAWLLMTKPRRGRSPTAVLVGAPLLEAWL